MATPAIHLFAPGIERHDTSLGFVWRKKRNNGCESPRVEFRGASCVGSATAEDQAIKTFFHVTEISLCRCAKTEDQNQDENSTRPFHRKPSASALQTAVSCNKGGESPPREKRKEFANLFFAGLAPVFRDFKSLGVLNTCGLCAITLFQCIPPLRLKFPFAAH